ncbi:alpha/beta fold hydrolase [Paenibacillus mesotrionivorans]|uniref:Alpha/beta fold hydrolase n=1 Tax=Paenibacillus mesotrionivorans TaxID=3160968 RepID=A0ACC7NUH3_9BACL
MKKQAALLSLSLLVTSSLSMPVGAMAAANAPAFSPAESQSAPVSASPQEQAALVPLRQGAELLGARVEWNGEERSVTASRGSVVLKVWIDSAEAELSGAKIHLGAPVRLVDEQTVLPVAALEQFAGLALDGSGQLPVAQDDLTLKATAYVYHLLNGNREQLAAGSSPALMKALGAKTVAGTLAEFQGLAVAHPKLVGTKTEINGVHSNVVLDYELDIPPGRIALVLRFDKQGRVDDLANAPAASTHQPASYDNPNLYTEREIVVGEGEFALPGALTLPKGEGPFPMVILVHGSGPNDRDETIGGAKPFRDLASGLAAQGIAVLRYDKVTAEHSLKVMADGSRFSLEDETVADALRAVELAKTLKEIDPDNIFIAGHSQGGYALPLMLEKPAGASVKGAVLLSAPSGNMNEVLVEQQEVALQLLKETGQPAELVARQEGAVAAYKRMVDIINDPVYSVDHLPEQFPWGDPYWWIEQREYQPGELAKTQSTPMFITQGENDWQVSMKQYEGWKEALKERSNVTFTSYPSVNHLLSEYGSISMGMEYGQPSNVAASLVEDVANWVKKLAE